jgi:hypothetical protein
MAAIRRPIELPAQRVRFATLNDQDGPLAARQVIAEQPDACLPMVRIEHHGAAALSHPGTTRSVSSASETSGDGSSLALCGAARLWNYPVIAPNPRGLPATTNASAPTHRHDTALERGDAEGWSDFLGGQASLLAGTSAHARPFSMAAASVATSIGTRKAGT